jgi:hypothetical protein
MEDACIRLNAAALAPDWRGLRVAASRECGSLT